MAIKTVLKLLISRYAPLSLDMQKAVNYDQWVIIAKENEDTNEIEVEVEYIDNPPIIETTNQTDNELLNDWIQQLNECKTTDEVDALYKQNKPTNKDVLSLFTARKNELSTNI